MVIKDAQGGVGYVFPREAASEYRALKAEIYPAAIRQIADLQAMISQKDSLEATLHAQIQRYAVISRNSQQVADSLSANMAACDRLIRKKQFQVNFYRVTTYTFAALTVVVLLFK